MERSALERLKRWHAGAGRKPLVMRGARQVGKSYLVRQSAAQAGLPLFELNLEKSAGLVRTSFRLLSLPLYLVAQAVRLIAQG